MNWIEKLLFEDSVAHSVLVFAFVIACGILLGKLKIKGISLGITFVLFVGIIVSHFGFEINHDVLHFMKDFGLILFVYAIGLQVGPGFLASFKKGGLQLNMLAASIVIIGILVTLAIHFVTGTSMITMVGIMSGAVTNTPGLGAAQETFFDATGTSDPTIAMGYAVAYPFAVIGIIMSMILMRYILRVDLKKESDNLKNQTNETCAIELLSLEVSNESVVGLNIREIASRLNGYKFIVSRVLHHQNEQIQIACSKIVLNKGDKIYVVTTKKDADVVASFVGNRLEMTKDDWNVLDKQLVVKRILVTRSKVNGKSIQELSLRDNFGVNITRINRSGVELIAEPNLKLQFGDRLTIVGDAPAIENVEKTLGNQLRILNEPMLIPIFIGILLGVVLGSIPIPLPGVPQPLKLGLSSGPLIVAIVMSIIGAKYRLVTYTTLSANLMLKEIGICIFLACVGLGAGGGFVDTIVSGGGIDWISYGIVITVVPILLVGIVGKLIFKINYYTLMGLISGGMTDPPALAYADSLADNNASAVSYATVFPLTTFLRVLGAQLLILLSL